MSALMPLSGWQTSSQRWKSLYYCSSNLDSALMIGIRLNLQVLHVFACSGTLSLRMQLPESDKRHIFTCA